MIIREATPDDRDSVQRLYEDLCPTEPVAVLPGRIEQIRSDPHSYLFVLETDGNVQATAFMTVCLDPMFGSQPYAVLENLVVDPSVRGQGVGTTLLQYIERVCLDLRCSKIMLLTDARRRPAHRFLLGMGYSDVVSKGFKKYLGGHHASAVRAPDASAGLVMPPE